MSVTSAILISLGICVLSAILEGVLAGKNVKSFFAKLGATEAAGSSEIECTDRLITFYRGRKNETIFK